jgi:hypothetical protein
MLLFLILISSAIQVTANINNFGIDEFSDPLEGGWVEEVDGVTILHTSGTHYEMGYQHGSLLKEKIDQNYRIILDNANPDFYEIILEIWEGILAFTTPDEYIEEMHGIADGSGKTLEEVAVYTIGFLAFIFTKGCSDMVAWGPATYDEELYHYHSTDEPTIAKDDETGIYLHENQAIMVRNPDDGYASLGVFIPGGVGCWGGINEKAISISGETSTSFDETNYCILPMIQMRIILDSTSSVVEALEIFKTTSKGGGNYFVGDGKIPVSYVCELTANYFYIGTWNDPTESTRPFWKIDHVIRRKNMFLHPLTSKTQRKFYNPWIYIIPFFAKKEINWFIPWRYYKTISQETERMWGDIDLNKTMDMARSVYRGETDNYLGFRYRIGRIKFASYHQWAACPMRGDFAISFARGENFAQYEDVHHFNLFELLNSVPSLAK